MSSHESLLPGACSDAGFLCPGEKLEDTVVRDDATLAQLGVTREQVADALDTLLDKRCARVDSMAQEGTLRAGRDLRLVNPVVVDGRYRVDIEAWMGAQQCPFETQGLCQGPEEGREGSVDVTVRDVETSQEFRYNMLHSHLIRAHGFFESPSVRHRLDPRSVVSILRLEPGTSQANDGKWRRFHAGEITSTDMGFVDKDGEVCWMPGLREANLRRARAHLLGITGSIATISLQPPS